MGNNSGKVAEDEKSSIAAPSNDSKGTKKNNKSVATTTDTPTNETKPKKVFHSYPEVEPWCSTFGFETLAQAINLHKCFSLPVIMCMMYYFDNFTQPALVYCCMHGFYGILWLIKHNTYRDHQFEKKVDNMGEYWMVFTFCALFWVFPFLLMKYRTNDERIPDMELVTVLFTYPCGIFLHYTSDCQKFFTLKYKGRGLIKEGLFAYNRNPNYLGEFLIYISFVILSHHWISFAIFFTQIAIAWIPNMIKKDKSLTKYPDFEEYKKKSVFIIPGIF